MNETFEDSKQFRALKRWRIVTIVTLCILALPTLVALAVAGLLLYNSYMPHLGSTYYFISVEEDASDVPLIAWILQLSLIFTVILFIISLVRRRQLATALKKQYKEVVGR